jgi:hypothetical protein
VNLPVDIEFGPIACIEGHRRIDEAAAAIGPLSHKEAERRDRQAIPRLRVTGDPRNSDNGAGGEAGHVVIDDHSRTALIPILPDHGSHCALVTVRAIVSRYAASVFTIRRLPPSRLDQY